MLTDQQLQSLRNMGNECEDAADEIEALRVDAKRYRWMRDVGDATWKPLAARVLEGAIGIDAAIDAARTKGDKS